MAATPVAVQLYTLRDETAKDFVGTLNSVAGLGYAGVEFAGYGGLSARELRGLLGDFGLSVAGAHVGLPDLETKLQQTLEFHLELGNRYLVVPWLPEGRRRTADDWRRLAEILTEIGGRCREAGTHLAYHNHAFEFDRFEGRTGLDILMEGAPANVLLAELDVYWAQYAGEEPAACLRKLGGRCPLVHLKDMAADRSFAEVGTGTLDFPAIFAATAQTAEWYIVEQDQCRRPPLESVRISLENLRAMGIA